MFNISCTCGNLICVFSVFIFHVPLQGSGKWNCGWWYRLSNSTSSVLPLSIPTSELRNIYVIVGLGVSYLCKLATSCTCGKSNYIFFLCRFPFPTSKHEKMYVWGVGSLFNSCTCSTSHAPAAIWFACFQFLFSMSHFKVRENEIVGGGIGCSTWCSFAQIWHPYNCIFRSSEVGIEKGRTEEIEFDNLYHHPQFHFPEPWSGTWKIKTENTQIRLSQAHEMLSMCMNWTNYQHPTPTFSRVLRWEKENDKGRKCNLTCRRCTGCDFTQIRHPSPYNYIFRSFEVGNEKGRTEEIELTIYTTTHNFDFPEPWSGTWKIKTENTQIRLPQVHEMLNMCMNWTNYQHPTPTFSRVLRWEKVIWLATGARNVVILHTYDTPAPTITFPEFEVGNEKGRTEEIEFDNLYHHPQFHFPEPWSGTWKI